ncbi:probable RNA-directed DNA polymerase from transposon X-element [Trichonephila clavipes]|nr:probable RNA-directed DNA polymerase from transposon X-element [Trichonephila clavipes]
MDELTSYIADEDPDVVALQETFLRPSDDLNLANYSTHRSDRLTHRGGEQLSSSKKSIPHHGIKINTSTVESTTIVIESQPNNITICSLYNPPEALLETSAQISSRFLEIDPSASSWVTSTRSIPLGVQPLTTTQQAILSFPASSSLSFTLYPISPSKPDSKSEKNRLRKLWQRTQYPPLKAEVNRLQRIIRTELKNSKEHVWDSLQKDANIDTDTLHKLVAGNNSNNNILYPPILSSRGLVFGTKEKADCFVDNLEESFTENRTPYDDDHIDKVDRSIRRFLNNYSFSIPPLTSPQEICDIISKLNIRKAPGHDQIKNIALKSLPMNAITHLTKIFNKCLLLQHFPQIWKHCTISLLPKKNKDPKFPLNYRPISLISCVAKLFEKILLSRIQAFSDSNHIIPDFQHGFRKKTSTCHQLLRTTNLIIDGFNTHRTTG